ncbi:MAG: DUF6470 family protein [Syntrophomonadaceae bacterium]|nr:DUF6470 family protein [Syntrophomonadaceae bacterium]
MDIKINQQAALIGLNIQKPQVKLSITPPKENVSYSMAEVRVSSSDPKVWVDMTQVWADIGLKDIKQFSSYTVSLGRSVSMEGIARRVQEGRSLAAIDEGGTVAGVVKSRVRAEAECPFTIAFIPEHAPEITPEVENLEIEAQPGGVSLSCEQGGVENDAPWAKVDMYLLQKPYFDIKWVGSHYDAIM